MILSRAPVRFSLGGGGTDLPTYAKQHGAFVVTAAVDKYIYIAANQDSADQVEHRIMREALRLLRLSKGIEIVSMADVPSNCGPGSSSAFTVSLLNALHAYKGEMVPLYGARAVRLRRSRRRAEEARTRTRWLKSSMGRSHEHSGAVLRP